MGIYSYGALALVLVLAIAINGEAQDSSSTLVPAIFAFGDSTVDVGNNNYYLPSIFKANYPPYGRDFKNHLPTGRFSNGKLASDITADNLGFTTYPLAYLSPRASGNNLLIGANFASAGCGYDEKTSILNKAITLSQQLQHFKGYQAKLVKIAGRNKTASTVKDALYLVGSGSGDFFQNYYVTPINKVYTPEQYSSLLIRNFSNFIKELYGLGARRIGVTSLAPLGCFPAAMTLFGLREKGRCISRINRDALVFNKKINSTAANLQKQLPSLKLAIFDTFTPLYDLIKTPSKYGFVEARKGCCGAGKGKPAVFLCNPKSHITCANATQYVFWDGVHPSEAANQVLSESFILQGINLVG